MKIYGIKAISECGYPYINAISLSPDALPNEDKIYVAEITDKDFIDNDIDDYDDTWKPYKK